MELALAAVFGVINKFINDSDENVYGVSQVVENEIWALLYDRIHRTGDLTLLFEELSYGVRIDVNYQEPDEGDTLLHAVADFTDSLRSESALPVIKKLFDKGARIIPNNSGYTPLHIALGVENSPQHNVIKIMLQNAFDADILQKTENSFTVLFVLIFQPYYGPQDSLPNPAINAQVLSIILQCILDGKFKGADNGDKEKNAILLFDQLLDSQAQISSMNANSDDWPAVTVFDVCQFYKKHECLRVLYEFDTRKCAMASKKNMPKHAISRANKKNYLDILPLKQFVRDCTLRKFKQSTDDLPDDDQMQRDEIIFDILLPPTSKINVLQNLSSLYVPAVLPYVMLAKIAKHLPELGGPELPQGTTLADDDLAALAHEDSQALLKQELRNLQEPFFNVDGVRPYIMCENVLRWMNQHMFKPFDIRMDTLVRKFGLKKYRDTLAFGASIMYQKKYFDNRSIAGNELRSFAYDCFLHPLAFVCKHLPVSTTTTDIVSPKEHTHMLCVAYGFEINACLYRPGGNVTPSKLGGVVIEIKLPVLEEPQGEYLNTKASGQHTIVVVAKIHDSGDKRKHRMLMNQLKIIFKSADLHSLILLCFSNFDTSEKLFDIDFADQKSEPYIKILKNLLENHTKQLQLNADYNNVKNIDEDTNKNLNQRNKKVIILSVAFATLATSYGQSRPPYLANASAQNIEYSLRALKRQNDILLNILNRHEENVVSEARSCIKEFVNASTTPSGDSEAGAQKPAAFSPPEPNWDNLLKCICKKLKTQPNDDATLTSWGFKKGTYFQIIQMLRNSFENAFPDMVDAGLNEYDDDYLDALYASDLNKYFLAQEQDGSNAVIESFLTKFKQSIYALFVEQSQSGILMDATDDKNRVDNLSTVADLVVARPKKLTKSFLTAKNKETVVINTNLKLLLNLLERVPTNTHVVEPVAIAQVDATLDVVDAPAASPETSVVRKPSNRFNNVINPKITLTAKDKAGFPALHEELKFVQGVFQNDAFVQDEDYSGDAFIAYANSVAGSVIKWFEVHMYKAFEQKDSIVLYNRIKKVRLLNFESEMTTDTLKTMQKIVAFSLLQKFEVACKQQAATRAKITQNGQDALALLEAINEYKQEHTAPSQTSNDAQLNDMVERRRALINKKLFLESSLRNLKLDCLSLYVFLPLARVVSHMTVTRPEQDAFYPFDKQQNLFCNCNGIFVHAYLHSAYNLRHLLEGDKLPDGFDGDIATIFLEILVHGNYRLKYSEQITLEFWADTGQAITWKQNLLDIQTLFESKKLAAIVKRFTNKFNERNMKHYMVEKVTEIRQGYSENEHSLRNKGDIQHDSNQYWFSFDDKEETHYVAASASTFYSELVTTYGKKRPAFKPEPESVVNDHGALVTLTSDDVVKRTAIRNQLASLVLYNNLNTHQAQIEAAARDAITREIDTRDINQIKTYLKEMNKDPKLAAALDAGEKLNLSPAYTEDGKPRTIICLSYIALKASTLYAGSMQTKFPADPPGLTGEALEAWRKTNLAYIQSESERQKIRLNFIQNQLQMLMSEFQPLVDDYEMSINVALQRFYAALYNNNENVNNDDMNDAKDALLQAIVHPAIAPYKNPYVVPWCTLMFMPIKRKFTNSFENVVSKQDAVTSTLDLIEWNSTETTFDPVLGYVFQKMCIDLQNVLKTKFIARLLRVFRKGQTLQSMDNIVVNIPHHAFANAEYIKNLLSCGKYGLTELHNFVLSKPTRQQQEDTLRRLDQNEPVCLEDMCETLNVFVAEDTGEFTVPEFDWSLNETEAGKFANIGNVANMLRQKYCTQLGQQKITEKQFVTKFKRIASAIYKLTPRERQMPNGVIEKGISPENIDAFLDEQGEYLLDCENAVDAQDLFSDADDDASTFFERVSEGIIGEGM